MYRHSENVQRSPWRAHTAAAAAALAAAGIAAAPAVAAAASEHEGLEAKLECRGRQLANAYLHTNFFGCTHYKKVL